MNKVTFHKQDVVEQFGQRAMHYGQHAKLQKRVADRLAQFFPDLERPDILEIGCGTGFLTQHLLANYPDARFDITDLSPAMLDRCASNISPQANLHFSLMDGEQPDGSSRYDLIATSMTAQWFEQPEKSLAELRAMLKPEGYLLYSSVGSNLFPQWRFVLQELGYPCGLVEVGEMPGVIDEEQHQMKFTSGVQFLQNLKMTGASTPHQDYRGLSAGELRRAIRLFETKMQSRADWHILYGQLRG